MEMIKECDKIKDFNDFLTFPFENFMTRSENIE